MLLKHYEKKAIRSPLRYGFIITKPLQLMIVMAIIDQLPNEVVKELLIVDGFFDAKNITETLNNNNFMWRGACFFQDPHAALKYCKHRNYDSVFLDSDVGFRRNFDLIMLKIFRPKTGLNVYEEGLGTYRSNLYHEPKKMAMSFCGIGTYFGGNWLTKKLYLFAPAEYRKIFGDKSSELIEINISIPELIIKHEKFFDELFKTNELRSKLISMRATGTEKCDIYLSSWDIDANVEKYFANLVSCRVAKLHPHIKVIPDSLWNKFDFVVSPAVPAEILITITSNLFKEVEVFHHGSSVVRYLDISNVRFKSAENL